MGTLGNPRTRNGMTRLQVGPREACPASHPQFNMASARSNFGPLTMSSITVSPSQADTLIVGLFNKGVESPSGLSPSVRGKKGIARGRAPLSAKDAVARSNETPNPTVSPITHLFSSSLP